MARQLWSVEVWSGGLSFGLVSCVPERQLRYGMDRLGVYWSVKVWFDRVLFGSCVGARYGMVTRGLVRIGSRGAACYGLLG